MTGASTFQIETGLDSGPVFGVLTEEVRPTDTSGDLLTRLAFAGSGLLVATMDGIEDGTLEAVPQPAEGVTLAPKIEVEDAKVDWTAPALRVDRVIRGCAPAPGAWTVFRGERLKLMSAASAAGHTEPALAPGELADPRRKAVYVGHRQSYLSNSFWVQPQGKKPMKAGGHRVDVAVPRDERPAGPAAVLAGDAAAHRRVRPAAPPAADLVPAAQRRRARCWRWRRRCSPAGSSTRSSTARRRGRGRPAGGADRRDRGRRGRARAADPLAVGAASARG